MWSSLNLVALSLATATAAVQPCQPEWADWFPSADISNVRALPAWDRDGPGPGPAALYAAGSFRDASGVPTLRVARFDGERWWPLGAGVGSADTEAPWEAVSCAQSYDADGAGPQGEWMVFGGRITSAGGFPVSNIGAWDGAEWHALGAGLDDDVAALCVYDADGPGPSPPLLIAAGEFKNAGGAPASGIAAWNGEAWSPLGEGLAPPDARSLVVHDPDGEGPQAPLLVVAGNFSSAGGIEVRGLAAWDGENWSSLSDPGLTSGIVRSIDLDGPGPGGPMLTVSGWTKPFQPAIATLDAGGWSILAQFYGDYWQFGPWPQVTDMVYFDPDAAGPDPGGLYAGGLFGIDEGYAQTARLVDGQWQMVAPTMWQEYSPCFTIFDADGTGPEAASLYITQSQVRRLGRDGPEPLRREFDGQVESAAVFDPDAAGPQHPALIFGGDFTTDGQQPLQGIVAWDGRSWSDVGGGLTDGHVFSLAVFDENDDNGSPPSLFAGGFFEVGQPPILGIARWNGKTWSQVGGGLGRSDDDWPGLFCLLDCDPDAGGPLPRCLVAGGYFDLADGTPALSIAAWDGATWHSLGHGFNGDFEGGTIVMQCTVFDEDGDGPVPPRLFAGGDFRRVGPDKAEGVAAFDGNDWSEVGGGTNYIVRSLVTFDPDGPGPEPAMLLAQGDFTKAGAAKVHGLARWDGQAWSGNGLIVGDGMTSTYDMSLVDEDGPGPAHPVIYLTGELGQTPWSDDTRIARWDGHTWSPPPAELYPAYFLDAVWFDEDSPGAGGLYYFPTTGVGDIPSRPVARYGCPPDSVCAADLDGSGVADFFDVLAFLSLFNTADPAADCDGSGGLDLFDFLCFVNAFNAGCP